MRHQFGGSPSDYAMEKVGTSLLLRPAAVGTVWNALSGGTQLTDLTDLTGTPITTVTADSDGAVAFYGPDGVTSLYVDFGYGRRYVMAATDTGSTLAAFIAEAGAPNGLATLDSSGQVPATQLRKALDWLIVTATTTPPPSRPPSTPARPAAPSTSPAACTRRPPPWISSTGSPCSGRTPT
jgi:hypothetical protein